MTDDKTDWLKRMVREAGWSGFYTEWVSPTEVKSMIVPVTTEQVLKFAELVEAAEREACAKILRDKHNEMAKRSYPPPTILLELENAILTRSNTKHTSEPEPDK